MPQTQPSLEGLMTIPYWEGHEMHPRPLSLKVTGKVSAGQAETQEEPAIKGEPSQVAQREEGEFPMTM